MQPYRKREVGPREIYKFQPTIDGLASEWTKTAGGGGDIEHPFQILDASAGSTPAVNVRYGTMMDILPTNVATDIALPVGTSYLYLKNEVDIDGIFVGSELINDLSPQPANDDVYGYITLGNAIVVGTAVFLINQAATHSLRMAVCNRVVIDDVIEDAGEFEFWGF